ncbi:MAG: hypothetical protein JNM98_18595 [Rhodocyclaceae bacterium]|nr:hypothetical protein [Rhodocyclaceae bacterium]
MRSIVAVVAAVALAGCATTASPPIVRQVRVATSVPCKIEAPPRPAYAVDALPLGAGIRAQVAALRAERLQRQGYESELEAAVTACQ